MPPSAEGARAVGGPVAALNCTAAVCRVHHGSCDLETIGCDQFRLYEGAGYPPSLDARLGLGLLGRAVVLSRRS